MRTTNRFPASMLKAAGAAVVLALASLGFTPGQAAAAPCVATSAITNPDASLTNATSCGVIDNLPNANTGTTETAIETATGLALTFIDRDTDGSNDPDHNFRFVGGTSGSWAIDTTGLGFNSFLISFKDGAPLNDGLVYFVVDTTINTPAACTAPYELCGSWLMYGASGTRKNVSHADLFAYNTTRALPEPNALLLLGTIFGAIALRARRRKP